MVKTAMPRTTNIVTAIRFSSMVGLPQQTSPIEVL
jgi:hypothetical protein